MPFKPLTSIARHLQSFISAFKASQSQHSPSSDLPSSPKNVSAHTSSDSAEPHIESSADHKVESQEDPLKEVAASASTTTIGSVPPHPTSDEARKQLNDSTRRKLLRKLCISLALLAVGCALGAWGYSLIPQRDDVRNLPTIWLIVSAPAQFSDLRYYVTRVSPTSYSIIVLVEENQIVHDRRSVTVAVAFPQPKAVTVQHCPPAAQCTEIFDAINGIMLPAVTADERLDGSGSVLSFRVHSSAFAFSTNGVNALASLPQVEYYGPGFLIVKAQYGIPNGRGYNWSSFSPANVANSSIEWDEEIQSNQKLLEREITGTNYSSQAQDSQRTFFAGALVGVGLAAIVGALQEGLHVWADRDDSSQHPGTDASSSSKTC